MCEPRVGTISSVVQRVFGQLSVLRHCVPIALACLLLAGLTTVQMLRAGLPMGIVELVKTGVLDDGGDGIPNVGDVVNYSFQVTSTFPVEIEEVTVTDDLVATIDCPDEGNGLLILSEDESVTCTGSYALTQTDIDAGVVTNAATVNSVLPDFGALPPVTDDFELALDQFPSIQIVKEGTVDVGMDGVLLDGDTIDYTFEVANTGNVTLTNIDVSDDSVSPVDCPGGNPIATLAPGGAITCTGSYAVTVADLVAGQKTNTATAEGSDPDMGAVNDSDEHTEDLSAEVITFEDDSATTIPTLGQWGLLLLAVGLAGLGLLRIRG